jgi:hypothetical protein
VAIIPSATSASRERLDRPASRSGRSQIRTCLFAAYGD